MMTRILFLVGFAMMGLSVTAQGRMDSEEMLKHVNEARANDCLCGDEEMSAVGPLQWDDKLARAAQRHANDMARRNFFSHTGSDRSSVSDRVERQRFDWQRVGENLAEGFHDVATVVQGWINSPGHCKNIMNGNFTHIGAAVSRDGKYWVQVFATPMPGTE
ncbi:hypothetical protein CDL62_09405 [Alkalitalea saponilacus]|uniref:Uncharacterized conserved protein YkwD, contains CAP (CSP/antigen 5/PR1) domain n=2 Tax=Alkalitalea saponilacus TaxID=889453 RepID=A0A1T5HND3_9BACT|nr:hypothetical protein CDL62_09405 [Alkalitalea saponilacus]SKC22189.1 Uncharacterized conserved protein YkwD, contains CAP (CSP/antigen 5/PR1) domain [Alkalitalea saponilacus]